MPHERQRWGIQHSDKHNRSRFRLLADPHEYDYPDPVPPLWAVEIISPTDKAPEIRAKRQIYPESQSIDVYVPGQPVRPVTTNQALDVGLVIPGFTLSVNELFGI